MGRLSTALGYLAGFASMLTMSAVLVYSCASCSTPALPQVGLNKGKVNPGVQYMLDHTVRVRAVCPTGGVTGSGVILTSSSAGTVILTAKHVGDRKCLMSVDNHLGTAIVTHRLASPDYDLAFLTVPKRFVVSPVKMATAPLGIDVYTTGYPKDRRAGGVARLTLSRGVVMTREYKEGYVRISAHILQGASGGPVWDSSGQLVGIISRMYALDLVPGLTFPIDGHYYMVNVRHAHDILNNL